MSTRLAGIVPANLTKKQAELYDAIAGGPRSVGPQAFPLVDDQGVLRGPFNAMLLSPPMGLALQAVGVAIRYRSVLSPRAREMAILAVASHWGSAFEPEAHEPVARALGVTEAELRAIHEGNEPELTDPEERTALRAAFALARTGNLSDSAYREAVAVLGERALFDLTTLVGYYATLAMQLRVFAGESPECGVAQ
ncbi:carboxymuconolactone decarboxylase family protein [Nocardia sp. NPDC127526]|uniref:carboxymuconolactone decarboxylase family protein n=1 Tax=Nocardia sp. NPDC127526 TaxID=3345393 RepID=UPI00362D4C25